MFFDASPSAGGTLKTKPTLHVSTFSLGLLRLSMNLAQKNPKLAPRNSCAATCVCDGQEDSESESWFGQSWACIVFCLVEGVEWSVMHETAFGSQLVNLEYTTHVEAF